MEESDTPTPDAAGAERFGRLRSLNASSAEGWNHEAYDFTPWLADNLELLGDELGLVLRLREHEAAVGRYSLDLLLEDAQGRTVIVENQFGQTDHDHLGKLLTYCAGTEAEVVIWLAESITDEHVGALEWLNENTVAGVGFFGVELGLLKIDDSRPAPRFRVVVQPNEWKKRVRPEPSLGAESWDWAAFGEALGIDQQRIDVGRALVERIEAALRSRGLPWKTVFRKGYVSFQRSGGYNVLIVDLWRRIPRFAVKVPGPLDQLGVADPYPGLESSWAGDEREWGWSVPSTSAVPSVGDAIEIAQRFQPESGPMRPPGLS